MLRVTNAGDDIFALQLTVDSITEDAFLAWNDNGLWVNAVEGNSATGNLAEEGFAGSFAASGATATADYLGSWGFDTATGSVWAVLDHNSEFAILIPEPGSGALILLAGVFWTLRRRIR